MLDGLFNGFVRSKGARWGSNLQREDLTEWAYEGAVYTRACVSTVWASCLRKAHPILFLQEKSPYACKVKERIDLGLLLLYKHKNKAEKQ